MSDHHIPIPPALKPYVRFVWLLEHSASAGVPAIIPVFADGHPGLIFYQCEQGMVLEEGAAILSNCFVYGQTINPIVMKAGRSLRMITVMFHPAAMQALFRFNARELTGHCLDIELLPRVPRTNVGSELLDCTSSAQQIKVLFDYLLKLIERNRSATDRSMVFATEKIIMSGGNLSLRELHNDLQLTERTFERKFEQHVGVTPKLFARIARFHSSMRQLRHGRFEKLSDIAYDNGFADQSHFIRTFRSFTGYSPLEYQKQAPQLSDNFAIMTR